MPLSSASLQPQLIMHHIVGQTDIPNRWRIPQRLIHQKHDFHFALYDVRSDIHNSWRIPNRLIDQIHDLDELLCRVSLRLSNFGILTPLHDISS